MDSSMGCVMCMMDAKRLVLSAVVLWAGIAAAGEGPAYPLKVGPTGRYLVDQRGAPVFINGDSPWSLAAQLSREDVDLYLRNRAALGVNSLIVTIPEGYYADGCRDEDGPNDHYGNRPFLTRGRFTTPNPAYFEHADWVIRRAGEFGMQVLISPMYTGYDSGKVDTDGWHKVILQDNSVADCRWYGRWIGARYRDFPNLIYVIGNDRDPGDLREKLDALAEGIRAKDPNHLMTYHARPGHSSADVWELGQTPWLTLNGTYTYGNVWTQSLQDYGRTPTTPFILFESRYENEGGDADKGTVLRVRRQAYQSVLGGSCGHHYGNGPVWHMNAAPGYPNGKAPWRPSLDDPGARTLLPNIKKLFESRAWYRLAPDRDRTLIVRGYDVGDGIPAACTDDGGTAIAYLPTECTVTVALSRVSGSEARAWWFNPRDGGASEIGRFPTQGEKEFHSPSAEDWVLVLDDASRNLPAPGTVRLGGD
ncbi:MAG: glycoside hydrolase family 140 protein [FCB group bacterium]|jgi:hypothetical protein|nr:glycoside hydrolase family 140 protein [FCB group bacterium]